MATLWRWLIYGCDGQVSTYFWPNSVWGNIKLLLLYLRLVLFIDLFILISNLIKCICKMLLPIDIIFKLYILNIRNLNIFMFFLTAIMQINKYLQRVYTISRRIWCKDFIAVIALHCYANFKHVSIYVKQHLTKRKKSCMWTLGIRVTHGLVLNANHLKEIVTGGVKMFAFMQE